MLVAETETEYRFVTQPAHAALAGRLAEMWVREDDTAATAPEVAMATYNHDNGWWAYDRRPHLTDDGTPVGVGDVPAETWVEFYESGIDSVVELDPYAGLLASLHGSGLRRERYGLTDGPPSDHAAYDEFVDREERRQRRLAAEEGRLSSADEAALATLHQTGTVDDTESRLWREYRLLETWDICSIALCTATAGATTEIPTAPSADVLVEAVDDATVTVEPYPFETSPLTVQVPTRTVEKESFDTESALCREYYRTTEEFRSITVTSA